MTMTTSLALHLAAQSTRDASSPAPLLVARPHGSVHVAVSQTTPGGGMLPSSSRPVCGVASRRLYVLADDPSPVVVGQHRSGQTMCRRCVAHLARAEGARVGWASHVVKHAEVHRQELLSSAIAGGTAFEVVVDDADVGVIAHGIDVDGIGFWHVHSAGLGVPVDRSLRVGTRERAVEILAVARERAWLPGGALAPVDGLNLMDRRVLDFAARTYDSNGRRDAAITAELAMTPTKYHQRLNSLVDTPAAERYAPVVVHRRRRLRHHHRRRRRLPAYQIPAISVGSPA